MKLNNTKVRKVNASNFKIRVPNQFIDKSVIDNHINTTILTKIANKNPNTSKNLFSYQDPWGNNGVGIFTRDSNCWLSNVSNISCASPAQLSGFNWRSTTATLISPRHFITAKHWIFTILEGGTPLRFVDVNNNVITRKAVNYIVTPSADIAVGILDSDVPDNIKFAKVLPNNCNNYFDVNARYAVFFDQEEKALIGINGYVDTTPTNMYIQNPLHIYPPLANASLLANFYETVIGGDSGNPVFLLIDNELVIITCWHGPISGPSYAGWFDTINNFMNQLGGGYNLTPIDLDYVYNKYK